MTSAIGQVVSADPLDVSNLAEALATAKRKKRFTWFKWRNGTRTWTGELVLFTGFDERNNPPPEGYQKNTGLTVGGVNVRPGAQSRTEIQPQINVLAHRVKAAADLVRSDGKRTTFTHRDAVAPPGKYFIGVRFGIVPVNQATVTDSEITVDYTEQEEVEEDIRIAVELVDSDGNVYLV